MIDLLDTVYLTPSRLFLSTDILFEQQIGQNTVDILYIGFTYMNPTKDDQPGCSRHSNWLCLRGLGTWWNNRPPVRWSTFRFRFLKWQLMFKFGIVEMTFYWLVAFIRILVQYLCFAYYFSSHVYFLLWNNLFVIYVVLSYSIDVVSTLSFNDFLFLAMCLF